MHAPTLFSFVVTYMPAYKRERDISAGFNESERRGEERERGVTAGRRMRSPRDLFPFLLSPRADFIVALHCADRRRGRSGRRRSRLALSFSDASRTHGAYLIPVTTPSPPVTIPAVTHHGGDIKKICDNSPPRSLANAIVRDACIAARPIKVV